jgi:predicted anti-sigma-YlaC factor YlaD
MTNQRDASAHERAAMLIARERVEGIPPDEQEWLGEHLRECAECGAAANATAKALRSLRTLSIAVPRDLARRTQFRVQLRAQELRGIEPRWRLVWLASAFSWLLGATTAPYVWHALEWIGTRAGLPKLVWQMGFGVWWALPAIVAGVILLVENAGRAEDWDSTWPSW